MEQIISIVIPVKNGVATLERSLNGIFSQKTSYQLEVIIVDSGSTDGTLDVLKGYPVRLVEISPEGFNHGTTRNLGAQLAQGEFIFMTVQDAVPVDDKWLERMVRHFDDPKVAGVCGQQIVAHEKDKNPHEWFRPVNPPEVRLYQYTDYSKFEELSPKEKRWVCGWDDVNACYRAEVLKKVIPFSNIKFGEDLDWAVKAYKKGFKLVFDSNSRVYHYHRYNFRSYYSRRLIEAELEFSLFRLYPKKELRIGQFFLVVYRNFRYKASLFWIFYNWMLVLARWKADRDYYKKIKRGEVG